MKNKTKKVTEKLPEHMSKEYGSMHNFRMIKREEIREVLKTIDYLRMGCAYARDIAYQVQELDDIAKRIKDSLSVKNWGN